jgi:heterotetrameric sarcosine oxidase gamma subunit
VAGWEVTGPPAAAGRDAAGLDAAAPTITDLTPLAKVGIRAPFGGAMAQALAVPHGRAARDTAGALVIGSGPGEWLVIGPAGAGPALRERLEELAGRSASEELVTVLDLTHGRALSRLTGQRAAEVLAKVCGIDPADARTPDGAAFRSAVARLVTDVVRDDQGGPAGPVRSYLLHCERSYGQYLFDVLLDAGAEFGIWVDGFRPS